MTLVWFLLVAAAIVVGCWFAFPAFRVWVDGWKTRLLGLGTVAYGILDYIDPGMLATALDLKTAQGKAAVVIGIGILMIVFRELTKKPGALVKK